MLKLQGNIAFVAEAHVAAYGTAKRGLSATINTGLTVEHAFITQRNHTSGKPLYDAEVLKAECASDGWALWRESS